jgi:hypothetical protein
LVIMGWLKKVMKIVRKADEQINKRSELLKIFTPDKVDKVIDQVKQGADIAREVADLTSKDETKK